MNVLSGFIVKVRYVLKQVRRRDTMRTTMSTTATAHVTIKSSEVVEFSHDLSLSGVFSIGDAKTKAASEMRQEARNLRFAIQNNYFGIDNVTMSTQDLESETVIELGAYDIRQVLRLRRIVLRNVIDLQEAEETANGLLLALCDNLEHHFAQPYE